MVTNGRKAITFAGASESIQFLDEVVSNYVGNPTYFRNDFLRLGDYRGFKEVLDSAWNHVIESLSENSRDSFSVQTQSRPFFNKFLEQLSNFPQRLGFYLENKTKSVLEENLSKYLNTSIKLEHVLKKDSSLENVNPSYYERTNKIRINKLMNYSENEEISKESLVVLSLAENFARKALMYHLENHFIPSLDKFTRNSEDISNSKSVVDLYKNLLKGYKNWLNSLTDTRKNALSNTYKKLIQILEDIVNLNSESDIDEMDQSLLNLLKSNKIDIKSYVDFFEDSSYKGKSFPSFPGIITTNSVSLLTPESDETKIENTRFQLPIIGSGWKKGEFNLFKLLQLYKDLEIANNQATEELDFLIDAFNEVNSFFNQLYISPELIGLEDLTTLTNLMFRTGSLQKLHEILIESVSKDANYTILSFKQSLVKDSIKIDLSGEIVENQNILVINNDWSKSSRKGSIGHRWEYSEIDTLPDIALYLLLNGGIWAEQINIFTWDVDLFVHQTSWENSKNYNLFRWLKSTIDSIALHLVLSNRVEISDHINFFNLKENDRLLIIPVLNFQSTRTNSHTYYYEILDGINAIDSNFNDSFLDYQSNRSYLNQQKLNEDEMLSNIFEYIQRNISNIDKLKTNIGLRVDLQHFNNLQLGKQTDFSAMFIKYQSILENPKAFDSLCQLMENASGYGIKFRTPYLNETKDQKKITIKFTTKNQDRTIILPGLFFLHLISDLGKRHGNPLHTIFDKYTEERLSDFLSQSYVCKALEKISGRLFNASGYLGRILNTNLTLINYSNTIHIDNVDFITVSTEAHTINKYEDFTRDSVIRIYIIRYSSNKKPKILFNEYFLSDRNKNIVDYRKFLDDLTINLLTRLNHLSIISIKNSSNIGEFLSKKFESSSSQATWMGFRDLSLKMIEKLGENYQYNNFWGFVNDFARIPLTAYKVKGEQELYLTEWEEESIFSKDTLNGREIKKYIINNQLISRPKNREDHYTSNTKKNTSNSNFYSALHALVNIRDENSQLSETDKSKLINALKTALLIGGESSKLGTVGISRLFYYPYTDKFRIVFTPSFLIKGLDFFKLVS